MSSKLDVAAIAAAMTALLTPALAFAMTSTHGKALSAQGARAQAVVRTPVVVAPDGRVLGTDPSPAVRFELSRDYGRGR